jgi:ADP-ribose pyrophosphatase YjhB (NUDIX family)
VHFWADSTHAHRARVEALENRLNWLHLIDGNRGAVFSAQSVGLLLRVGTAGSMTRTLVSGRVLFGETLRDALFRHLEKDLGPMAFPQLPISPQPAHIAEYFPFPDSKYTDMRQHAVSLVYVVPVTGTCEPRQDALEITWMTPVEASSDDVVSELEGGRGSLLRAALASVGALP